MKTFGYSAVANFCDDVRTEKSEKKTLVGVYGPRLALSSFPYTFPKLNVYTQFFAPVDKPYSGFTVRIYHDDEVLVESTAPDDFVKSNAAQSVAQGRSYSTTIGAVEFISLVIDKPSILYAVVELDGVEYEAGRLDIYDKGASTVDASTIKAVSMDR